MAGKGFGLALAALLGVVLVGQVFAKEWDEEYTDRIHGAEAVAPLSDNLFGDNISLYDGSVSFTATDISLPGNNSLAVELRRTFSSQGSGENSVDAHWELDIPHLGGVFAAAGTYQNDTASGDWEPLARCSQAGPPPPYRVNSSVSFRTGEYWSGNKLHLPGGGDGELLARTGNPKLAMPTKDGVTLSPWITRDRWTFSCTPSLQSGEAGEGFIGYAPDGTQYIFDWMSITGYNGIGRNDPVAPGGPNLAWLNRVQARLYPTRIQDRFGNWVTYTWTHVASPSGTVSRLSRIQSSDGRRIDLFYAPATALLTKATAVASVGTDNRDWLYQQSVGVLHVVNPDGSQWSYSGGISESVPYAWGISDGGAPGSDMTKRVLIFGPITYCWSVHKIDTTAPGYTSSFAITTPSGATAIYAFQPLRHGMNNVPSDCNGPDGGQNNSYPLTSDAQALVSKTVSGPGLITATTTYSYPPIDSDHAQSFGYESTSSAAEWGQDATSPPHYRVVTVTQPDDPNPANATHLVYTFGNDFGLNEGQLLKEEAQKQGITYRTTIHTYVSDAAAATAPFAASMGDSMVLHGDEFSSSAVRPQTGTTTSQDGVNFTSSTNLFDAFARATNTTRSSSLGSTRTDTTGYFDDLTHWVLGQIHTETNTDTGQVTAQTDYDPTTDLPIRTYAFGILQQTLGYAADGTLSTVTDGLNHTTTLSNWHRGIPQSIQNADSTSKTAVVNDSGWVTSVTDENGFATNYTYDPMGRMASIAYPTGDTPAWTPTTQAFEQIASTEYGIPAGHWRQTVSTGNARKVVYLDAFWRPVVTREYDNANVAGTTRFMRDAYDVMGRAAFASYPGTTDALTAGTHTTYDALGRPLASVQDSELGSLTTTTQYLTGFQTKVTNPRGYATTTSYQVFDSPDTSHPILIVSPEGVTTTIARDIFGKPLTIARTTPGG